MGGYGWVELVKFSQQKKKINGFARVDIVESIC